jgi:hypothetical protein
MACSLAALVALAGCSRQYTVRRSEYEEAHRRAQAGERAVVVPAFAGGTRPTHLELDAVRSAEPGVVPDLVEVRATDARPLLIGAGWYLFASGALASIAGLATTGDRASRSANPSVFALSLPLVGIGGGLLLGGYLADGPEAPAPPHALAPPRS